MKTKKIIKVLILGVLSFVLFAFSCYAAETVDPDIPIADPVNLGSDGEVTWEISNSGVLRDYVYKKFQIKLEKRYADTSTTLGYVWKDYGSVKTVTVEDNSTSEYVGSVDISQPGFYVARVRAYTVENVYGGWSIPDYDAAAAFDNATTNITVTNGSAVASNYGPGTVYNGNSGMQVASPYQNYGNATNIVGTNGQYVTSNGTGAAYVYDPRFQNNMYYQGQTQANIGAVPGTNQQFVQQNQQVGPGSSTQVVTGYNNSVQMPGSYNVLSNTNQIIQSGPSQSAGGVLYNQANWSKDVGWHVDNNGFYYYQGNGIYLRNQWYLIENNYYRFNESGYALVASWFKDPSNGGWYYLGPQGKMMTGWQLVDNVWYYLNPNRGASYGVMYLNCSLTINGKAYAFDSNGGCVINNYFNGYYYGADGTRQ